MSRRSVWYIVIAVGAAGFLWVLVLVLTQLGDNTDALRAQTHAVRASQRQIADCISNPHSDCYRDQEQRQAVFLQLAGVYFACAAGYADLPDKQRIEATGECFATWTRDHPELLGSPQQPQ